MKIAIIGQKGIPASFGGVERHVEALAVRLGRAGHQVTVYTRRWYAAPRANYAPGVATVATPTINTKHLDAIVHTFTSTVHAIFSGADVIHYHGVGPALLAWIPRVFSPRIRVVTTFHCIDRYHQKWGVIARLMLALGERAACAFPHATITVSRQLQAYSRERFATDAWYVPNGVDAPAKLIAADTLRASGLSKNGYVVMVSRLVRHKGAHHLIAAFQSLQRRGQTAGKKLVIVGGSAFTNDYVAELHAMATGNPDIIFTGFLKGRALQQMFANAYAVVHPSESEGLPIAVLEAMSFGKTVLCSDIPENLEVINDFGLAFRNRDAADLARKLATLLASPAEAARRGAAARDYVLENYRWDDVAADVARVYDAVMQSRAHEKTTAAIETQAWK